MYRLLPLIVLFLPALTVAQQATGIVYAAPSTDRQAMEIRWLAPQLTAEEGFRLYRRTERDAAWESLTEFPLQVGTIPIPPQRLAADSNLQIAKDLVVDKSWEDITGMARLNLVTTAITDTDFARFLGIHFSDRTVTAGTDYEYEVRRLEGGRERLVAVSRQQRIDGPPGYVQAPELAGEFDEEEQRVILSWSHTEVNIFAYHIHRINPQHGKSERLNQYPILVTKSAETKAQFFDLPEALNGNFRYELSAVDFLGRVSPFTTSVEVELPDLVPPEPPTEPGSDNSVDKQITLNWKASPSVDVKNYRIYRASDIHTPRELIGETTGLETSYTDKTLPGYGYYYYEVTAQDAAGNESDPPLYHIANGSDLMPPSPPRNVRISAESGSITLTWNENPEGDIAGYLIMQSVDVKGTNDWAALHVEPFPENTFTESLPPSRRNTMIYHVVAMDTTGNRSEPSAIVRAAMPDAVPPPVPFLQSIRSSKEGVHISWQAVTEGDMLGYRLERKTTDDFEVITTLEKAEQGFLDENLSAGVSAEYRLSSVDTTGNVSSPSSTLSATMPKEENGAERFVLEGRYRKRDQGVTLKWAAEPGRSFVFRRKGQTGRFLPLDQEITTNNFVDKPDGNGRFDYFVKTYYPDGSRAESQVLTVVIKQN